MNVRTNSMLDFPNDMKLVTNILLDNPVPRSRLDFAYEVAEQCVKRGIDFNDTVKYLHNEAVLKQVEQLLIVNVNKFALIQETKEKIKA